MPVKNDTLNPSQEALPVKSTKHRACQYLVRRGERETGPRAPGASESGRGL